MSKMIKILQVVQSLDFGGLERVVITLANNLDREKYQCDVLTIRHLGVLSGELAPTRGKVYNFNLGQGKLLSFPNTFRNFLINHNYDIVHTHDTTPLIYTAITKRLYPKIKHVYTEHSGIYTCQRRHLVLTRLALLSVNRIITVTKELKSYYGKIFDRYIPPSQTIYNGQEISQSGPNDRADVLNELNLSQDSIVVGTAVRFAVQKNLRLLIQAMPHVLNIQPKCHFVLLGDGPERQNLESLAQKLGVSNKVVFPGYRKDVSRFLAAMDIYVLPSLWEGLPLGLIEAAFLGKAIIATEVGGNPEIVSDGVTGFLVKHDDTKALAKKILLLAESPELRASLAVKAQQKVLEQFSVRRMVQQYEEVYNQTL